MDSDAEPSERNKADLGNKFRTYEALRAELAEFASSFDRAATTFPPLLHQWVWGDEAMQPDDWRAFIRANSRIDGDWQEWSVVSGEMRCGRFHGFRDGLEEFLRLAERGHKLLLGLREWGKRHADRPSGFVLNLPKETGSHGWIEAVYLTARCYATALLSERSEYWGVSGQETGSEDDLWTTTEAGDRFPSHPAYEELVHDICRSSAEAIRLWLDPAQAVTVGDILGHPRLVFPASRLDYISERAGSPNADAKTSRPVFTGTGELWVGRYLIKKFRQKAPNQRLVLTAFQEENWEGRIDDPLPGGAEIDPKRRLRDTVEALNDHHKMSGLIRFLADGTGQGIIWQYGERAASLLDGSAPFV